MTSMDVLDNVREIEPGDLLWIEVISDKQRQFVELVSAKGVMEVPGLVQIKAAGVTPRSLAFQMKSKLEKAGLSVASVLVAHHYRRVPPWRTETHDYDLVVFGSVSKQGVYKMRDGQDLTVSELLHLAGGINSPKRFPKIIIVRNTPHGHKRILVNAKAVLIEKRSEYDLFLRIGDVMIVE